MIFHNQLQPGGLNRLVFKYQLEMIKEGRIEWDGTYFLIQLNYHREDEWICLGEVHSSRPENLMEAKVKFTHFIIEALEARLK